MSRAFTSAMQTALASGAIAPVIFVSMDFESGFVRVWSGYGTITWGGYTWVGGGQLMALGQVEETKALEAMSLTLSLSGVPSSIVSVAYSDFSQGRPVIVWLGLMTIETGAIIADPAQIFAGRMDTISDQDEGQTATISVTAESNLADLDRLRVRYFTDQDQKRLFPSDASLRFVPAIQDTPIFWGTAGQSGQPRAANI